MSRYRPEPAYAPDGGSQPPWGRPHWQPSYQPMAWGSEPDPGMIPGPTQAMIDPQTSQPVQIDPTTGRPVPSGSSPATTSPATGFDLGPIFGSLQTTTVWGIPLLYIIIAGVAYFVFFKKGR